MSVPFHERFDIDVPFDEARNRFINRIHTLIFNERTGFMSHFLSLQAYKRIIGDVVGALGMPFQTYDIKFYTGDDFHLCLHAIEALYESIGNRLNSGWLGRLTILIRKALHLSEVDIGIRWENGLFYPVGAEELDEVLVNQPLKWLRDRGYETVLLPYEKSLRDFLDLDRSPEHLSDVITDAYEAVEALAKIICENNKDLSANTELFIRRTKASSEYKAILKKYVKYACTFRHAAIECRPKPQLKQSEVESFLYLTGTMIRLVILSENES
jgi:hypothetical protein